MLTAIGDDGIPRLALEAAREDGPFSCAECGQELVLRKGTVRVHHFAHRRPFACAYGSGETLEHLRAKREIFDELRRSPRVSELAVEEALRERGIVARPDVRFVLDAKICVAVEFQRTSLDIREIARRTAAYRALDVHVLWIASWPAKLQPGERYQPRETERYLHSLYFGRVFMWRAGAGLMAVRFGDYMVHVDERTWYDEHGDEHREPSYSYASRQWVTPAVTGPLELVALAPRMRREYEMKKRLLPEALLFTVPGP
jgi:competence protein CoiA